jgi:hypothetical protein
VYDALYANAERYAIGLDGLAERLAELVRELAALPSAAAARVIALAESANLSLPDEWSERLIHQLTTLWERRTTEFGRWPDGTAGPVENTDVSVTVIPEQWDACSRIGAPDSLSVGAGKALAVGIKALDRRGQGGSVTGQV